MPSIENLPNFKLPPNGVAVLQKMFATYQRVVIKEDFSALGYSGSWVYRVHLLKEDRVSELPVVVKIASVSLIEKENLAYQECIKNNWLGIAKLRVEPVFLTKHDPPVAGLCYSFMGGGLFQLKSLRHYALEAKIDDIRSVLEKRLFHQMKKRVLLPANKEPEYPLRASYDSMLPANLVVKPLSPTRSYLERYVRLAHSLIPRMLRWTRPFVLITPDKLPNEPLSPGTAVRLEGFSVTKVDLRNNKVVDLNLSLDQRKNKKNAYRWRLRSAKELPTYRIGQLMPPLQGVVMESRQSRSFKELAKIRGARSAWATPAFELTDKTVTLPNGPVLPNPLLAIPTILRETRDLRFNYIHGDLNLENVLVDPQVSEVYFIDFAEARYDHVLHDFLRLESEVVTKLLPVALASAELRLEVICQFYEQLHDATFQFSDKRTEPLYHEKLKKPFAMLVAIRQAARDGFYDPDDFSEYYQCLTLYLVGTLRFKNLDKSPLAPLPKQVAFLAAATIQQWLNSPASSPQPPPPAPPPILGEGGRFAEKGSPPLVLGEGLGVKQAGMPVGARKTERTKEREHGREPLPPQSWGSLRGGGTRLLISGILLLSFLLIFRYFLFPELAVWNNNEGFKDYLNDDFTNAERHYEWALFFHPSYPEAHYNFGLLYEDQRDFERAQAHYQLAAEGNLDAAYNNLARLYIPDEAYNEAVYWLLYGLERTSDDEVRYDMLKNLGWARLGQERYAEAESRLKAAIQLRMQRAPAYCLLAQAQEGQKKKDEALKAWENCLKYADPRFPDEDEWIHMARLRLKENGGE